MRSSKNRTSQPLAIASIDRARRRPLEHCPQGRSARTASKHSQQPPKAGLYTPSELTLGCYPHKASLTTTRYGYHSRSLFNPWRDNGTRLSIRAIGLTEN